MNKRVKNKYGVTINKEVKKMNYKFYCCDCKHEYQVDIPMQEYHEQKEKQKCPECGGHARRVYEWSGIATGSGEGWCGKKGGSAI